MSANKIEIYNTFCNARINELKKQLCMSIKDFDPEVVKDDAELAYEDVLGAYEVLNDDDAATLELQLQYMLHMLYESRLGEQRATGL